MARAGLAVVTGASSGIGLELAKELAARHYQLVVCAEDEELATAADGLRGSGVPVQAVRADLATADGTQRLVDAVGDYGAPVDVLALNAGIGVAGPFIETPLADDLRLIALNITSVVHTAKKLVPEMVARGQGRVLITSSIASLMPGPWYATYAASKAFLLSFAEALRHEVKDSGVTVTALMPGPTDTEFFERAGMQDTVVNAQPKDDPADVARMGVEAMLAGDDHVVASSVRDKLQALAKGAPEPLKAAMHARLTQQQS
jgi:uncharacterized protein